jgi:hypothetical protein
VDPDALFAEVRGAAPYAGLERRDFDDVQAFVATGGYALRGYDRFRRLFRASDGTWRIVGPHVARQYRLNVGTIVEAPMVTLVLNRRRKLGEVEEWFVQGLEIGDTFKNPKFRDKSGKLRTFDRAIANPMWNQDWFTEADYDADELGRFPAGAGFPGTSSADWGWTQHILASLNDQGRAAVVWDTGAVSRGSGNAGTNKEKTVRQWFVDQDLIESVLYLPENLFYNTTAPGIVLFLNKAKPKERQGRVFLVNAGQVFEKGDPKNFIPDDGIQRISNTLIGWTEEEIVHVGIVQPLQCHEKRPR